MVPSAASDAQWSDFPIGGQKKIERGRCMSQRTTTAATWLPERQSQFYGMILTRAALLFWLHLASWPAGSNNSRATPARTRSHVGFWNGYLRIRWQCLRYCLHAHPKAFLELASGYDHLERNWRRASRVLRYLLPHLTRHGQVVTAPHEYSAGHPGLPHQDFMPPTL